jgi:ubiquinone/menaquinone biosynthesis C-methylase UbiE
MVSRRTQFERQREIFDREFSRYTSYHLENWRISYLQRMYGQLRLPQEADPHSGERFLDIGVGGSGYSVIEAARRGVAAVGIDLSEEGIRKARGFAQEALNAAAAPCGFVVASAEALPFASGSFHWAASVAVLEHVPRDGLACAEMARVTGPRGRIFVSVPNTYARTPLLYQVLGRINDRRVGHLRHYEPEQLTTRFERLGMRLTDRTYHAHNIKIVQWLLSLVFPAMRRPDASLWWRLERQDLQQRENPRASMFSLALTKTAHAASSKHDSTFT